ncbi:unnamed protein product, partial [marine sediment metagenome]
MTNNNMIWYMKIAIFINLFGLIINGTMLVDNYEVSFENVIHNNLREPEVNIQENLQRYADIKQG